MSDWKVIECPKCKSRKVNLQKVLDGDRAEIECRECRHAFTYDNRTDGKPIGDVSTERGE